MFISYKNSCRSCLSSIAGRGLWEVNGYKFSDFEKKTEFEVMQLVESWHRKNQIACNFCGSNNIELSNLQIEDFKFYDFNRIAQICKQEDLEMLEFEIIKTGYNNFRTKYGGKQDVVREFVLRCFEYLKRLLVDIPDSLFIDHSKGNFFISFTGGYNIDKQYDIVLQKLTHCGITKSQILNVIDYRIETDELQKPN